MVVQNVCIVITTDRISVEHEKPVLDKLCGPSVMTPKDDAPISRESIQPAPLPDTEIPISTPPPASFPGTPVGVHGCTSFLSTNTCSLKCMCCVCLFCVVCVAFSLFAARFVLHSSADLPRRHLEHVLSRLRHSLLLLLS